MKRLFSALLCLALIAGSAACSDDETTRPVLVVNAGESFLSLDALARERGQSLAEMALAWLLRDARVSSVIIGASSVEQITQNLRALQSPAFSDGELERIDRIALG